MSPALAADTLAVARLAVEHTARAIERLGARLDDRFAAAVERVLATEGKLVLSGVGKSGLVAQRLAATLTSTGTPAFFLHPTDAVHGDAGILESRDTALFVSKSGGSEELEPLLEILERLGIPLIALTARAETPLGRAARIVLETGEVPEAGPLDVVPTTSATVAQVLGDALALAVLARRGFGAGDFAFRHPGGVLGRTMRLTAGDLMHAGAELPRVEEGASLRSALVEILEKGLGIAAVTDRAGHLAGVLTDGDLKRILLARGEAEVEGLWSLTAGAVMSRAPEVCARETPVASAVRLMEERDRGAITALVVIDDERRPLGVLHLHDCLRAGVTQPASATARPRTTDQASSDSRR